MFVQPKKLSILIPTYNEASTIIQLIEKVMAVPLINAIEKEIIVINDCSTDNTFELLKAFIDTHSKSGIIYIEHEKNQGKGSSIHNGIAVASGDYMIVQDADLEYHPIDYNLLLNVVLEQKALVVYGSRLKGRLPQFFLSVGHKAVNQFLTFVFNLVSKSNLTDLETCYKLIKTDLIKSIDLKEKRFGFEPEITAKLSRIPYVEIHEVGISYNGRAHSEGKKIGWVDGVRALYCIFKYSYSTNNYVKK